MGSRTHYIAPAEVSEYARAAASTNPHSTELCGAVRHHSSKASRGEDLEVEHPVSCGDAPALHFHPTLPRMYGATLVGNQINWLRVLGVTETPQIDQGVRHQFHPVVALLDVLETEQQP